MWPRIVRAEHSGGVLPQMCTFFFNLEEALGIGSKFLINPGNTEMKSPTACTRNMNSPLGSEQLLLSSGWLRIQEVKYRNPGAVRASFAWKICSLNACWETSPDFSSLGQICNASCNLSGGAGTGEAIGCLNLNFQPWSFTGQPQKHPNLPSELSGYTGLAGKITGMSKELPQVLHLAAAEAGDGFGVILVAPNRRHCDTALGGFMFLFLKSSPASSSHHNPLENENKGGSWLLPNHPTLLPNCETSRFFFFSAWKCIQK